MYFSDVQERLLGHLRDLLRGGETTERRLAHLTGISQPHVHNILKGVRELTPATADRVLHSLQLTVLDLVETVELAHALDRRPKGVGAYREVPVLNGKVGPGWRWTAEASRFERLTLPAERLTGMQSPVAARLAPDPLMGRIYEGGEMAIVDLHTDGRDPHPDFLYLLERGGDCAVRWVRMGRSAAYLINGETLDQPRQWEEAKLEEHGGTVSIKGRVIVPPRNIMRTRPEPLRRPPGTAPGLVRHSAAS